MNFKYTLKGQMLSVIFTHIQAAVLFFIVWLLSIAVTGTKVGGLIYSAISSIFYFFMMYSAGYTAVKNDKKSYVNATPFWYKGFILALSVLILNIAVLVIYKLSWAYSGGETVSGPWSFFGNMLGLFWFSPYINLLGMEKGYIHGYGYAIILLFHITACFLGYFAGYKNFDISAKLKVFVYEKKK